MLYWRAPTQRISKRNSTGNASWRGPNIEAGGKSAYNNVQVGGAPTQRISKRNSTGNASWGRTEINFAKISFLFQSRDVKILKKIMPLTKYV
ncbi:hypothetical protein [Staphylococcus aureus]|uniref:hypothetical protein n=1 Tax=Staphylococcus aureus TaxID=1280 RepID=UPI00046C77FB|nr:hypothetical protein RK92_008405 [Staphylococcus aureus]SQE65445.1 nitrogen regulation protein NIFR3 [Staphylococcus aureus]SQE98868.1 nitrogen regulation protein NIFR3 [Staphylococcus aureus]SUK94104.1 nitrogen regulation protein NIFR3 [Staphylococcus aureus]VDZ19000.1 nitrogen regulation protein NIFR3 [Staphylococcus aureus]